MTSAVPRLLVDCSVVVKWELSSEPHASEARDLLADWEHGAIEVCVPDQLLTEIANALLANCRKHPPRLSIAEARDGLREMLSSLRSRLFVESETTRKG